MKPIKLSVVLLLILFAGSNLGAQKLYTWTDEKGVLHITDNPPPKRARIKDVTKYREKTPQEIDAIQREKNIKRYYRQWKVNLIEQDNSDWRDLSEDFTA